MADEEKKVEDYTIPDFDLEKWELDEKASASATEDEEFYVRDRMDPPLPDEYSIKIEVFKYKDKEKHYWDCSRMIILKDGEELVHVNRNYGFGLGNIAYANQNGNEFIITSGNYQTFCVINLKTKEIKIYYRGPIKLGGAWCPSGIIWEDTMDNTLSIDGCVWGGDYGTLYITDIKDLNNIEMTGDNTRIVYNDDDDDWEEEPDDEDLE